MTSSPVIAAIVPCYNEELAVGKVVRDLRAAVPGMTVYVYDNNSSDRTAEVAREAGAIVRREERKGKGNVVRRAFADVDADIYVMIDGDDTYDAAALPEMIRTLQEGPYDHVLGVRDQKTETAYRPGHELGNRGFNWLVGGIFGSEVSDMLSGYRVMSRRFVKSFPAASREFEIETELTVHVMSIRVPQTEVHVGFRDRPAGSESKLRTYHDGFRILSLIVQLIRYERPLLFYGLLGAVAMLVGVVLGIPLVVEFAQTGLVPRFPTAVLAVGFGLAGALAWTVGFVLDGVLRARREQSRLIYLQYSAPAAADTSGSEPPLLRGTAS
ncbi:MULTISPECIES: glycosyltransferase [Microbacterium]|uniref:Glycosyl transferase n=1 Tax=Microbacterium barkeri TaxID=33917 RepID=A0A9W6LW87_9MICO|nr:MULTISPECIES: glycosyltransferase [Microbacterium]MDR6876672.1 glycosyltransferase involved in cell wall biosynthesis [Microbacterium barkeri]WRH16914.1 glycosyltransferase [Microbacterium sp. JZ37]GLJ61137.1 glycosyl transferase [Microbacterium barkeri]